jgi:hypothetical protein
MTNTVFLIRLKSGEDIVSEMIVMSHDGVDEYLLINPQRVFYERSSVGYNMMMAPWVFPRMCDDQEFTISKSEALFIKEVSQSLVKKYEETVEVIEALNDEEAFDKIDSEMELNGEEEIDVEEDEEEEDLDIKQAKIPTNRTLH